MGFIVKYLEPIDFYLSVFYVQNQTISLSKPNNIVPPYFRKGVIYCQKK
ncbi:hypothetical protein M2132_001579 [Dysgonomonas sp. PH5-45]|nr:hypothetical protein [Dysgonomonas sp. PH5-45]